MAPINLQKLMNCGSNKKRAANSANNTERAKVLERQQRDKEFKLRKKQNEIEQK